MDFNKETALVETILFLESEPLTAKVLSNKAQLSEEVTEKCLEKLKEKYMAEDSGIELVMITGGWCLAPKKEYWDVLKEFYERFEPMVKNAFENMEKKPAEETGELCPECHNPLVIRKGKYGEFVACSDYPNCTYTKNWDFEYGECPDCGHPLRLIEGEYGDFLGCTNYHECKYTEDY